MNYVPSATANRPTPNKDNRNTIYAILVGIILLLLGYIIYDKSEDKKVAEVLETTQQKVENLDSAKNVLQAEFDVATMKLDTLTANNAQLEAALSAKNLEITRIKSNINTLLQQKNISAADLKKAQELIAEYKGQVDNLLAEVAKLKSENKELTAANLQLSTDKSELIVAKEQLTTEKKNLEDKVDVATTLKASNFNITAIKVRGEKEKETTTAKRADLFRISFVLDENRVAPSGAKTIYVVVKNPDGSTSVAEGSIKTRDGAEIKYTNKVNVNYEQGKVTPVSFDWKSNTDFVPGDYIIEVYHNGFKIGEAVKTLKKGGLFS
ncbi:MAG: hypothetical protein KGZ59_07065 [Chitinophagaceae bacterium]|nr:hypothetical protein [Chitinophagaceae bacterium]